MTKPPIEDLLTACGFDKLGEAPPTGSLESCLKKLQRLWLDEDDPIRRQLLRGSAVDRLQAAGVSAPARVVDAALDSADSGEADSSTESHIGTLPTGVVDVVQEGGNLLFAGVEEGRVEFSSAWDDTSTSSWGASAIPWPVIPTKAAVLDALRQDEGVAPWDEWRKLLLTRVVLPEPKEAYASLLCGWGLGTYRLADFAYFPLLMLAGPPERGKTRLGKALIYPGFRGFFSASVTSAVLFRVRAHHRATMFLDVEDLPRNLSAGDLNDLLLNSFERGGKVGRVTRPDAPPGEQIEWFATYGGTVLRTAWYGIPARFALDASRSRFLKLATSKYRMPSRPRKPRVSELVWWRGRLPRS